MKKLKNPCIQAILVIIIYIQGSFSQTVENFHVYKDISAEQLVTSLNSEVEITQNNFTKTLINQDSKAKSLIDKPNAYQVKDNGFAFNYLSSLDCSNYQNYDDKTKYQQGNKVVFEGKLYEYINNKKRKDKQPDEEPNYWSLLGDCSSSNSNNTTSCNSCSAINPATSGNYTLPNNQTICFTTNATFNSLSFGNNSKLCIAPGVKVTVQNNIQTTNNTSISFNIEGTLQFNQNPSINANVTIDIANNGTFKVGSSGSNNITFNGSSDNIINNSGSFQSGVLSFQNNSANQTINNSGSFTASGNVQINGNVEIVNNSQSQIAFSQTLDLKGNSTKTFINSGTVNISGNTNIEGKTTIKNNGTIGFSSQLNNNNSDLLFINCGVANFSAGINGGSGRFINTNVFNVSGSFQIAGGELENYGVINSSSNFNVQNQSLLYNEGKIVLNGNNSNLTNVWIKGPESGKKGYFESNHKLSTNNQTNIGPNLDFKRTNSSSSSNNVFHNPPTFVDANENTTNSSNANVTFDCRASNSCSAPLVTSINECPDINGSFSNSNNGNNNNNNNGACEVSKDHIGNCWNTTLTSVVANNGKFDIEVLVTYTGNGGCKELSHFSVDVPDDTYSNIAWQRVTGNVTGNIVNGTGNNDPFNKRGFKLDGVSNIGDGDAGSFKITYTLNTLQNQDFLAKAGNDYSQIASFTVADFQSVLNCSTPNCPTAENNTATSSITESETKQLVGNPSGGTWSVVSGGGTINGNTYTPDDINTNTDVTIRYTIAADGSCSESTADVTFTVTPVCITAANTTSTASITEADTKELVGNPTGGTWSVVSGGGTINGNTYTPDDINTNTDVTIRYTIAADGSCSESTADVTFTVTPVCIATVNTLPNSFSVQQISDRVAITPISVDAPNNDLSSVNVSVSSGTLSVVVRTSNNSNVNVNNPSDITITGSENRVNGVLRTLVYTPEPGFVGVVTFTMTSTNSCNETVTNTFIINVEANCITAKNNTTTASISEDQTKELIGNPTGGSWSIVSGGGTINGNTYTPDDINTNTDVTIRYTIAADGSCSESTADVTFTVTPVCIVAENNTTTASISEDQTKELIGNPAGGTWSVVSGGGTINGNTYTPDDINTNTDVTIRYTIAADGSCSASTSDVTFTVTPVTQLGTIGDTVWFDTDGDGLVDAGEPRLEGATVTLDPGTPGNAADDLTTTTDANGNYLFDNLTAGTYTITVDVSTVTNGIPAGKTFADLIQTFDADGLSTPNTSSITLAQGEDNLDQDFAYNVTTSGGTTGGNDGGVESESLGDAISKIYIGRKKNSIPTEFVKDASNRYNKVELQAKQPYQGKGQTMLDMFPEELVAGDQANVTSPTDILDYTIADEVLSVDFSLDGETKGVVLGIKTSDRVYNHTKASCDRLRGAEILNVMPLKVAGYNFLMQGIKQRNGEVEYAVSFAASKNNNDTNYSIQANWYVNNYTKFNDMYNFQVWATDPQNTKKLVADIISNLQSFIPVKQVAKETNVPKTYASKVYRDKAELVIDLRSTDEGKTAEIDMVELYSETANNIKHRHEQVDTKIQQSLRVDIADGYEYDATIEVTDTIQDAFYHADGNWGLDYDGRYTEIKEYFVYNNFDREYLDDEYTISRDVVLQATSDYDYLTLYKSLLPGTISADYSAYKYLSFKAKGSGLIELGLVKASITDWKEQYKVMVDLSEEERTYYIPFEIFSSIGTEAEIVADDLTTLTFTWLPVEANTTELDLEISDVKFTKEAVEDLTVGKIETFENEFLAYPNPSLGNVTTMLFSEEDTEVTVTLTDVTGKTIYKATKEIIRGKNELEFNFNVKPGVLFLKVASDEIDYGTSKIIFR